MKTKNLLILTGVLAVLIIIVVVFDKFGGNSFSSSNGSKDKDTHFYQKFSKENCSAFSIKDKSGSVKIVKKGDKWVVSSGDSKTSGILQQKGLLDDYSADSESVASALEKIRTMKMDELISENKEKQTLLEVDTVNGTILEVWDNEKNSLGKVIIGKSGPDYNSQFVREMGSDKVFRTNETIKYSFFTEKNRWRDKTIIKCDKNIIKKIIIAKKGENAVEISKTKDTAGTVVWNLVTPEPVKANKEILNKIVEDMADIKTDTWEEDTVLTMKELGLDTPLIVVTIELENGEKKILHVGNKKKDSSNSWVRVDGNPVIFKAFDSKFENVRKSFDELIVKDTTMTEKNKSAPPVKKGVKAGKK